MVSVTYPSGADGVLLFWRLEGSLFGDLRSWGGEIEVYAPKLVTSRWPRQDTPAPGFNIPTLG
jgi:hypothetical protein